MIAKVNSCSLTGLTGNMITVETDMTNALPAMEIIGLPDAAVKEAKDRVRSGIRNCGFEMPAKRIVVNLAPAGLRKEGAQFDLPIAVSILLGTGQLCANVEEYVFLGELSLSGELRGVSGVFPCVMEAVGLGYRKFIVPPENAEEAALAEGAEVYAAEHLVAVCRHLTGEEPLSPMESSAAKLFMEQKEYDCDFSEVKGQENVKRALEIAAAGGHNVLMIGSPGAGKTMLAKRFPTILPDMTLGEALEVTKIYSVAGELPKNAPLMATRPFRSPHHNVSTASLVGGGSNPKPGELSLSHNGVLFLDEFPEFSRNAIETMRQPLEDGEVTISRVQSKNTYPCRTMLLAAMNPCPCGYYGDQNGKCHCSQHQISRYLSKISGPMLDRIDIQVEASTVPYSELHSAPAESSATIRERVNRAREIQNQRYQNEPFYSNAQLSGNAIETYCRLGEDEERVMKQAFDQMQLSARGYGRILKVARTIADLAGREQIGTYDLAEAISYRELDRKFF